LRRGDLEQSNVAWEGVWLKYAVFALKQMSAFLVNVRIVGPQGYKQ